MTKILQGQTIDFFCVSFLSDGTCLDEEENLETIQMKAGEKNSNLFYSSIAQCLIGMNSDQSKTVEIPCASAFGKYDPKKIYKITKQSHKKYNIGETIKFRITKNCNTYNVKGTISHIFDEHVELDGNHPLAGENIVVKIKIKKIHQ